MNHINQAIRIVVPAFNADKMIRQCVASIIEATNYFMSWELVVVDNGSNPKIEEKLKHLPVRIVTAHEIASAAYARNKGASGFSDGILIFIDSDVIVEKESLYHLIQPILNKKVNATIGNYSEDVAGLNFAQSYKQLYIHHVYHQENKLIQNDFWTAISAVDSNSFQSLRGFSTSFKGANGEDQEFGIRLSKNGYKIMSVSKALGKHLNPYTINKIIKNDFRKGLTAMSNSLENKVSLNDNRHANNRSIISVLLASIIPVYLFLSLLLNLPIDIVLIFLSMWMIFRSNLIRCFIKSKGIVFLIKSILLIYILDIVRFTCVMIGYTNHWKSKHLTPSLSHE